MKRKEKKQRVMALNLCEGKVLVEYESGNQLWYTKYHYENMWPLSSFKIERWPRKFEDLEKLATYVVKKKEDPVNLSDHIETTTCNSIPDNVCVVGQYGGITFTPYPTGSEKENAHLRDKVRRFGERLVDCGKKEYDLSKEVLSLKARIKEWTSSHKINSDTIRNLTEENKTLKTNLANVREQLRETEHFVYEAGVKNAKLESDLREQEKSSDEYLELLSRQAQKRDFDHGFCPLGHPLWKSKTNQQLMCTECKRKNPNWTLKKARRSQSMKAATERLTLFFTGAAVSACAMTATYIWLFT